MRFSQINQQLLAIVIGLPLVFWLAVGCSLPASSPPAGSLIATPPSFPTFTPAPPTFTPLPPPTQLAVSTFLPPAPSPPGHPTALPLPPTPDGQAQLAQAKVDISIHPTIITVGDLITVTGRVTNLGLPQYTLYLQDEPAVTIRYNGELIFQGFTGATVEFVSASASQTQAEFILRAAQPGTVSAMMSVSGEIRLDPEPGQTTGFAWSAVNSPVITLTVGASLQTLPSIAPITSTDLLADFPLNLGNTWVYSATYYDTYDTEPITATYRITETVVETKVYSSYQAAQLLRTSTVMTVSDNLAGKDWQQNYLAGPGAAGASWYIINGSRLYQQDTLDWAKIAADEATLEYIFPLSADLMWYPDPQQRAEFLNFEVLPGTRIIRGQADRQVPAGLFPDCFEITTFYNGGSPISWFCPGVGVIETHFDHVGTPFGHTIVLLDYRLW